MENTFWEANFWGIVGTVSGALGLIVSWLNWRYSHPNIQITHLKLMASKHFDLFVRENKNSLGNLEHDYVPFYLEIKMANKKGGPGAIEKPLLIFRTKRSFWSKSEEIQIEPRTISYSNNEKINLGQSFNLKGGEIVDDQLEYNVTGSSGNLPKLIQIYEIGNFYIRYHTNFGKRHEIKLKLVLTEH